MTSLRELRHAAQSAARDAQHSLDVRWAVMERLQTTEFPGLELSKELRLLRHDLKGEEGFSKEQQVARLTEVAARATELRDTYKVEMDKYGEEVQAALKALIDSVPEAVNEAKAVAGAAFDQLEAALTEAKELAETRDFEQHQKDKAQFQAQQDNEEYADESESEQF